MQNVNGGEAIPTPLVKDTPPVVLGRKLEAHKVNPTNDLVDIMVTDAPGAGGANHNYLVYWPNPHGYIDALAIRLQNGPIKENGVNGLTQEVLLTIVQDRLASFQAGPYACDENGVALNHVNDALRILKDRTLARMKRGVEGTHQK